MPTEGRENFLDQRALVAGESDRDVALDPQADAAVACALTAFANAADPEAMRPQLRKPRKDGTLKDVDLSNNSSASYLRRLRLTYQYGFDLLDGTAEEYNDFMVELVDGDPDDPTDDGPLQRSTASQYQSAARMFYRFCTEPGEADGRPDVEVEWPADAIRIFHYDAEPQHDDGDMFTDDEVNALREACLKAQNPRRDRAFIELLCGTAQRVTVIRTLRIQDVDLTGKVPNILINPEIRNDGDKGAIEAWGRWRPIVSDVGPIREWIENHPLRDDSVRSEHGCPDRFEDCYLFVGEPSHYNSDPTNPWANSSTWRMLRRRRDATDRIASVPTVTKPVDHHNFRHFAYTRSKELPIDEGVRRAVFGWVSGSETGETTYGHVTGQQLGKEFAEAWADAFDDGDADTVEGVADEIAGAVFSGELSPEAMQDLGRHLGGNEHFREGLAEGFAEGDG